MSELAPYVICKDVGGEPAYYWQVPKKSRPDIQVRTASLGRDRDAANAVARRMLEEADRRRGPVTSSIDIKTNLAREFAGLDSLSRQRALTASESEQLERVMRQLRMIDL